MRVNGKELADINISRDKDISDMTDEEVMKLHLESWCSINETEVYSIRDFQDEQIAASELNKRGIRFNPHFKQYYK